MRTESGRSLTEMMGMLAIMGIITLVGIRMYRSAMDNHHANELIYEANKRATMLAMQFTAGRETGSTAEFSGHSTFVGGTFDDSSAVQIENGQFKIKINELLGDLCQRMQQMVGEGTTVRGVECSPMRTGTGYIVFNADLSGKALCELNADLSSCPCPKHRATTGGKCGACVSGEDWGTWQQPALTSNTSYGELTASAQANIQSNNGVACTSSSHSAWCAFDGNLTGLSSKWFSGSLNAWLIWHLPVRLKISSVNFVAADVPDKRFPDTITVYGSNDGSTWQQIGTGNFYEKPSLQQSRTVYCDEEESYGYLKWEMTNTNRGSNSGISFAEIQIKAKVFRTVEYDYDPVTHACVERTE